MSEKKEKLEETTFTYGLAINWSMSEEVREDTNANTLLWFDSQHQRGCFIHDLETNFRGISYATTVMPKTVSLEEVPF